MSYLAMAKAALSRLRMSTPPHPEELARLLAMPLDRFAREGQLLEVRVPADCWPETLWFVPEIHHAEALCREGVARERIWTASELIGLLGGAPLATEGLRLVMVTRRDFAGEVVGVRPGAEGTV